MMQELVELQAALYKVRIDNRSLYDLKLHIIQRNLHGVDNDEFAVNIAMLRMWLSLSIEYEGATPEPLPNLDFKVVLGDSLLGPDPSPETYGDLFRHQAHSVADRLATLKKDHMSAQGLEKKDLKEKVEAVERELREALAESPAKEGAVDWRVRFAEVFDRGGFDVALANPPYVQLQRNGGELSKLYQDRKFKTFIRTGDIYQLFYERGCQMLRRGRGVLAYITSNSWLKAEYGKTLRSYFAERHTPLRLLDLGKDVFESAIVDSSVLLLREGAGGGTFPAVDMDMMSTPHFPPHETLWGGVHPDGNGPWSILSPIQQNVMDKMLSVGTPLRDWDVRINYGIKTGYNDAFIVSSATKEALIEENSKSAEVVEPVIRGRDISRYRADWAGLWLINIPWHFPLHLDPSIRGNSKKAERLFEGQYPAVYRHLLCHKEALAARNTSETGIRYEWYALQRWGANYHEDFSKEKLVWIDLTHQGRFAFDDQGIYCANTAFMLTGSSLKYLCAVLNSTLITWYIKNTALNSGMGVPRWVKFTVERIPVPKMSAAKQRPLVLLVDHIIATKSADPSANTVELEKQIDRLMYELYGLSEEEVGAVEGSG